MLNICIRVDRFVPPQYPPSLTLCLFGPLIKTVQLLYSFSFFPGNVRTALSAAAKFPVLPGPGGLCQYPTACPSCYFSDDSSVALFVVRALTEDPWEWGSFNTPYDAFAKQYEATLDIRFTADGAIGDTVFLTWA